MHATARMELVREAGEERSLAAAGEDPRYFARTAMLSEIPGLAIGLMTLFYIASSLVGLM